jgi:hypothetical protein
MNEKQLMQLIMATTQLVLTTYPMTFTQLTVGLIIQVGYFDKSSSYPGKKTDAPGEVQFLIDELENFDPNQPIYIRR